MDPSPSLNVLYCQTVVRQPFNRKAEASSLANFSRKCYLTKRNKATPVCLLKQVVLMMIDELLNFN